MARQRAEPQAESLIDANGVAPGRRRPVYRVERRTAAAIRTAKDRGDVDELADPLAAAALSIAQSLDRAVNVKPDPYAVVAASRELREVLVALGFTAPSAAGGVDAELLAALQELGKPSVPDSGIPN